MKLFDLHCDTLTETLKKKKSLLDGSLPLSDSPYEEWVQFFAVFIHDNQRGEEAWRFFLRSVEAFYSACALYPDRVCRVNDLDDSSVSSCCRGILSIEGGAALGGKLEHLEEAYALGVRMMTLTWNRDCELGSGILSSIDRGLSEFGKAVVLRMNQLGMVADVSHLSRKGFEDLCALTDQPFVASHSNAYAVCPNPRNLTDEQIKEIIRRGGLIGLNFHMPFLALSDQDGYAPILHHAEHILSLGGERVLAIGTDIDGADLSPRLTGPDGLRGLYDEMCRVFPKIRVDEIFYYNAFRFFKSKIGVAHP